MRVISMTVLGLSIPNSFDLSLCKGWLFCERFEYVHLCSFGTLECK